MENNYYVYRHIRLDKHEPFYVGKGKGNRAYETWGRNKHWKSVVRKANYRVEMIQCDITEQQAFDLEIKMIANYKEFGYKLCNKTDGGEGVSGLVHSAETRAKMSAAKDKKPVMNNFGEFYPSMRSAERATGVASSKISECCLSRANSAGTRDGEKIVWVFEKDREALEQRVIDANNASSGAPAKKVTNNFGEVYVSVNAAARDTGVHQTSISACCNGNVKSAGTRDGEKIVWVFEEDKNTLEQRIIDANYDKPSGEPAKRVTNNFGEVYDSLADAERATGVSHAHISDCCNGKRKSAGTRGDIKIVWVFEEDKDTLEQKIIKANEEPKRECKQVTNNFGDTYDSIGVAARETGIAQANISNCCLGKLKSAGKKDGAKLIWSFI